MPLQYDPEYAKESAQILSSLKSAPELEVHDVQGRRAASAMLLKLLHNDSPPPPDVTETVHKITSFDGKEIEIYQFSKAAQTAPGPAILHAHGGGMIAGDVAAVKRPLLNAVQKTGVPMFSVEYRLAPEHPSPTPVEDCFAGLLWLNRHAKELNVDPARIATMGESAGGGLAAGVALLARDRGLSPPLARQILVYPMLDDRNDTLNEEINPLTIWKRADNITGWTALLGEQAGKEGVSPYSAPARIPSVAHLPPTYIDVGGLDIFRDECLTYASRLAAANVDVEFHLYPGLPHGFELVGAQSQATRRAFENRLRAIALI